MMTDTQNIMVTLTEKFLNEHFPNEPHKIRPVGPEFAIDVGVENNLKLSFRVIGHSVYNVVIHQDHLDAILPLFGVNDYKPESSNIINQFLESINNNKAFRQVFNPIPMVDFSKHLTIDSKFDDVYKDIYDADKKVLLTTKTGGINRKGFAQFSFRFTKNNRMKCLSTIGFFYGELDHCRFGVGFDLDNQNIHSINNQVTLYEDFFIDNKEFDFETDIDAFVVNFLNDWIANFHKDRPDASFISDEVSFKDKVELFKMTAI